MNKATFNEEVKRVQESHGFKNFITQNYALKVAFTWVIYPIATILAMATSATHLWVNFETTISWAPLAAFLTFLLVVFLEVAKYFSADVVVDGIRTGIFSKPRPHQIAFIVSAILAVVAYTTSIYLDWKGAPIAAEYFKKMSDPVKAQYVSLDSINAVYDNRIAAEASVIGDAKKMTWKGKVIERGQKLINKAQDNKMLHEQQRAEAVAAAQAENAAILQEYEEKTANAGFWFQNLIGVGIFFQILSMIFVAIYNDGAKYEIERVLGLDLNGDGHIGAPSPPPASGGTSYAPGYGFSTAAGPHTNPSATGPKAQSGSYTPPPRMEVRGFHNANTSSAPADNSTATYCNTTATEEREILEGFSNENLKRMWKDLKRWWDSYKSPRYTKKTRTKHQDNYAAQMAMIEDILKSRAVDVDTFLNKKTDEQ
jgi:hypothetical protein